MANGKTTSLLGGAAAGAGTGAMTGAAGGPIGAGWGAVIGAGVGLISGLMNNAANSEAEEEARKRRAQEMQIQAMESQKQSVGQHVQNEQGAYQQMMNDFRSSLIR